MTIQPWNQRETDTRRATPVGAISRPIRLRHWPTGALVGLGLLSACGSDYNPYSSHGTTSRAMACGYESNTSCGGSSGTGWQFQCIPDSDCSVVTPRDTSSVGTTTCVTLSRNATVAADCPQALAAVNALNNVGVDAGSTPSPCTTATDCAGCTARMSCGWCAGHCWEGTSTGSTEGSCGSSPWAWTSDMCP